VRISALFDIRMQQWVRVDLLAEASANCKQHARKMLANLQHLVAQPVAKKTPFSEITLWLEANVTPW